MKPIEQSITGHPNWSNCLQASVASILEIDLIELPNFVTFDGPDGRGWWFMALCLFMRARGLAVRVRIAAEHSAPEGYAIAIGPSGRGEHAVVVKDGEMVHDPFPGGDGISHVNHWVWWEPMPADYDEKEFFVNLQDSIKYCIKSSVR